VERVVKQTVEFLPVTMVRTGRKTRSASSCTWTARFIRATLIPSFRSGWPKRMSCGRSPRWEHLNRKKTGHTALHRNVMKTLILFLLAGINLLPS